MDEKIKYIFFVFLGIIFYLIFLKKDLVEGLFECGINEPGIDAIIGSTSTCHALPQSSCGTTSYVGLCYWDPHDYEWPDAKCEPHEKGTSKSCATCMDGTGAYGYYSQYVCNQDIQNCRDASPDGFCLPNGDNVLYGSCDAGGTCLCDPGYYLSNNDCYPCAEGTALSNRTGGMLCNTCPAGTYSPGTDPINHPPPRHTATSCEPCAAGKFQDNTGSASCKSCSLKGDGWYQPDTGQSGCLLQEPGHQVEYNDNGEPTGQIPCSYNHYNDTTNNECHQCNNGSEPVAADNNYVNSAAVKCKCLPGFALDPQATSDNPNPTTCAICDNPQQHHHKSGVSACEDCPPGFIAGELGGKWHKSKDTCSFTNSEAFDVNSDLNVNPLKKLDGTPIRDSTGTNLSTITGNEKDCKIICGRDHRCKSFSLSADGECTFFKNIPTCNKGGNSDPYLHSLNRYDNNLGTWKIRGGGTSEKENLVYKTPGFCPLKCPSGTQPNPERTRCIECLDNTAGVDGSCDNTCDNQISNETLQGCSPCNDNEYVLDGICTPCPYRINSDGRCVTENEIEAFTNYEGYTNYDELNTKCAISRNTIPCSSDINNNISNGWTYNDITKNYVNKGAYNEIPDDLYIANSCSGDLPGSNQYYKNSFYDKLCFKNGEDEDFERGLIISGSGVNNLAEVYVKSEEECSEKCNEFSECGAFEYNDRCCIYKIGYGSSEGTEGNCHKKKNCVISTPDSENFISDGACICENKTSCLNNETCNSTPFDEIQYTQFKNKDMNESIPNSIIKSNQFQKTTGTLESCKTSCDQDENCIGYYFNLSTLNDCYNFNDEFNPGKIENLQTNERNNNTKLFMKKNDISDREKYCKKRYSNNKEFYNYLLSENNFCRTSLEDDSSGIGNCICNPNQMPNIDASSLSNNEISRFICPNNSICNSNSIQEENLTPCFTEILTSSGEQDFTCDYNTINENNSRDSNILMESDYESSRLVNGKCYCNVEVTGNTDSSEQETDIITGRNMYPSEAGCMSDPENDIYKYCRASDNSCQTLESCLSSDDILDDSCKYLDSASGVQMCNYLNSSGVKDKIYNINFPEKCKNIGNCEISDDIIEENEHCFCYTQNTDNYQLCLPGSYCSASGCVEGNECNENSIYNHQLDKCQPIICNYYSEDNSEPLPFNCTCETDDRHTNETPLICKAGYYCLNTDISSDIPFSGCQTVDHLKKKCLNYSSENNDPITENCYCGLNSSGEPNLCPIGKFCIDDICKNIDCPDGKIIDPEHHEKCINKDLIQQRNEEPPLKKFIDKFLGYFN